MCDPVTLAGTALTALSVGSNALSQRKAASARDDALGAERIRQNQLGEEMAAVNARSQERFEAFEPQQAERAGGLADYFTEAGSAGAQLGSVLPSSKSNITVDEIGKRRGAAQDYNDEAGRNLGNLRSLNDLLRDTSLLQARDNQQIGQLGGFARSSSNLLGGELSEANNAGAGLGALADVLGGAGSITTGIGLSGKTPAIFGGSTPPVVGMAGSVPVPTPRAKPTRSSAYSVT